MNFNDYQIDARKYEVFPDSIPALSYATMALSGEVGEFANKVKKIYRDHGGEAPNSEYQWDLLDELGDILWYVSALVGVLDDNLDNVAWNNLAKLQSRLDRNVLHGSGDKR